MARMQKEEEKIRFKLEIRNFHCYKTHDNRRNDNKKTRLYRIKEWAAIALRMRFHENIILCVKLCMAVM